MELFSQGSGKEEKVSPIQVVLFETERYMKEYSVENQLAKEYEEAIEDRFTSPTDEESTDSGEIDPEEKRRSQRSGYTLLFICWLWLHFLGGDCSFYILY